MALYSTAAIAARGAIQNDHRRDGLLQRLRAGALALIALAMPAAAWADSLALLSGAGQSGLIGTTGALPVKVEVRNVNGAVVAGRTINWTTSNGFALSASSSVTDANGQASVTFTYGNYGTTAIVATDPVGATSASASQTSIGSDSLVLVSGDRQTGAVGTSSTQPLVVEIRNAAGAPIVGRTVNWADQTSYTQVSSSTSVTDANGRASMNFSYVSSPPVINIAGTPAAIRASNSAAPSQQIDANVTVLGVSFLRVISGQSQSGIVGTTSAPVVVQATDWSGNPVAGATVDWADNSGFFPTPVTLSSSSTVTDANGNTSITYQFVGGAQSEIIASLFGGEPTGPEVDVYYTSVSAGSITLMSPQGLNGPASSVSPTPIEVELRNNDGTLAVGTTVNWTVQTGDAILNAPSSVTNGSGRASMGFTFGTVNSVIRATDSVSGRLVGSNVFIFATDTLRIVSGEGQTGSADNPAAQPIVVEVVDSTSTPIAGRTINWSQTPIEGNGVSLNAASSLTNASGQASVTFSYLGAGRTTITAQDAVNGRNVSLRVSAVGMGTLTLISGSGQIGLVNTHSTQDMVVEARDANGQVIVGRTINWVTTDCDAVVDAATSVTDALGRASMGFTFASTACITAMEATDTSGSGIDANVFFIATTVGADALNMISGNGQSGQTNTAGAQPMVVEARDAAGLPIAGRTIFWSVSVPPGSAIADAASSVTNAAGQASMTFTYGSDSVSSTLVANDSVTGQQILFKMTAVQDQGFAAIVSGNGQTGLPGTAGPQPIVLELRDGGNQPLPGQSVVWSVVSGPATLGTVTTITDVNGQASANFNFGPTPGTSIIQVKDALNPNGPLLQATVTALGNNQSVVEVSGNDQILAVGTPSAPMVVELRDFANVPVVGATIDWTTSSGTLANASTVTDANGQSSNTVTVTEGGTVTVEATSLLAAAPFVFTLNSSVVATLPNLTPLQESVAVAIDNSCVALTNQATLTPEEADFLARCEEITAAAGIDADATTDALDELITDTAQAQSSAAVVAAGAQFQNIKLRQMALRSGSKTSSLSNLTLTGPGGMISLGSLMNALAADEVPPVEQPIYSRWGFFAAGNIGRGEADAGRSTPAYDYDIDGITAGIDYRQSDAFILGAALGYTRQDTDLAGGQGTVEMTGTSLSAYGTYSFKEVWYLDGVITYGWNGYEMTRRLAYTLPTASGGTTSVNQVASGNPDGDLLSGALTFGGDFHKEAFSFSPYGQMLYTKVGFDSYEETMQSGPGSGLGLAVDARTVTALTGILGSRFSYTHSTDWGVLVPTASVEWNHEFKDDENAISARFIHDPTQTVINVDGDPMDTQYFRIGIGLSMVLARGRSGFFLYDYMVGRDGQSQENFAIGIRVEF